MNEARWRELNDLLDFPEDDVASELGVERAESLYGAPSKRTVEWIAMLEGPDVGAEVKGGARVDALGEKSAKERHLGK